MRYGPNASRSHNPIILSLYHAASAHANHSKIQFNHRDTKAFGDAGQQPKSEVIRTEKKEVTMFAFQGQKVHDGLNGKWDTWEATIENWKG